MEEFLDGEEASYFIIVDKNCFKFLEALRITTCFVRQRPNTGGMGAYSPTPIINKNIEDKIISKIIKPTLDALKRQKSIYWIFVYRVNDKR